MKKKVHKITTVKDGKEETIVTTDTHVEHDDKGPEDLQAAMKEIIDNFVEVGSDFHFWSFKFHFCFNAAVGPSVVTFWSLWIAIEKSFFLPSIIGHRRI